MLIHFACPLTAIGLLFASLVTAQEEESGNIPFPLQEVVAENPGEWQSIMPLICSEGCLNPASSYYVCFMNTTLPTGGTAPQDECDNYLCMPETYNHLVACLNCIIANGNERPIGYDPDSSVTAVPLDDPLGPFPPPVGGYLDSTQANGWLSNVTNRCSSIGRALGEVTTTLTATPTTTGPYQTAWSKGQTIEVSVWTGLTEYSNLFIPTETAVWWGSETGYDDFETSASTGSPRSRSTSAPTAASSSGSNTASAPAEATSNPNGASPRASAGWVALCLVPLFFL